MTISANATGDQRALLTIRGITFRYDEGPAVLDGLELTVIEGEIAAIVGPSGCGKSTLLSIVAGVRSPRAGAVVWTAGLDDSRHRRLTLVFQKDTLLPWLTVEKNVGFGLRYLPGLGTRESNDRVTYLLQLAGLEGVRGMYPYQLSGGMRRRLAFLVGVAPLPRVLLLDEPFSSLDEPSQVAIHGDVLRIIRELGMTVVLVTHNLAEAITLADRVHVLTTRPSHVAATYVVPFGRERDIVGIREADTYHELYRAIWHELSIHSRASLGHSGARPPLTKPS